MERAKDLSNTSDHEKQEFESNRNKLKAGLYVIGFSVFCGITASAITSRITKRKSLQFYKELNIEPKVTPESPTSLAFRALAWATFYTVGSFSITIFAACKWFGITCVDDLRMKVKTYSKSRHPTPNEEKVEFETFSDFLRYLEAQSKPKEKSKGS